jgi:anti-anti-sigma factor
MFKDSYPVQWTGERAVVTLPEHIDVSNADQVREELLMLINRGAGPLIADMTGTLSCDRAGAEAVARAHKRAAVSGTQLRLVVTAEIVWRVLSIQGIDRLVSIYPSLKAAIARTPAEKIRPAPTLVNKGAIPRNRLRAAVITPTVLRTLVDALADGLALTDDKGMLALVNRPVNNMFGYEPGELAGRPVETLVPVGLRHHIAITALPTREHQRPGRSALGRASSACARTGQHSLSRSA